ncbi:hypothetical protein M422DRAFT_75674 [Sphaerobolus stellatus SS14]|uniref:Peptide hydrolase n=1 Tax=Sphaerobolus stellatus (strain SS14) TaxID=990650 RepID=A0A0C9VSS5_SPHS4|nr:hypothetical protein M422DRAFT_75674 [Sphaerobolus stellatus SS14]
MKFSAFLILIPAALRASAQLVVQEQQRPLLDASAQYPGFHVDLNAQRLLEFEDGSRVMMSELEKLELKMRGERFFDVTETPNLNSFGIKKSVDFSYPALSKNETVRDVIKTLTTDGPKANLEVFSGFKTRYYRSDSGRESQEWLLNRIKETVSTSASDAIQSSINVQAFPHSWTQSSIILRINGTSGTDETVVIGAHQDSTNMLFFLPAPGADDDGSGTVTILEALRGVISSGLRPKKNVEFHWYSGEEGGLLGSQAIAQAYKAASANVYAMIQMDMTAWVKKGTKEVVGVVEDFVDPTLTDYVKELVEAYLDIPYVATACGYACSDHGSWSKAGYRSSFTIESEFHDSDPNIHSTRDTIDVSPEFSFTHMLEFSKLAAAFAIELGEWEKA